MTTKSASLVHDLAGETVDWMADGHGREDVADYVWAFTLATYVNGRCHPEAAITPRGFDVSDQFGPGRCMWCYSKITDEPPGSTLCADCFFGIDDRKQSDPDWVQRIEDRIAALWDTDTDRPEADQ